jgi:hypothetical protein
MASVAASAVTTAWSALTVVCASVTATCAVVTDWALIVLVSVKLVWALLTATAAADTWFSAEVRLCAVGPALSWDSLDSALAIVACAWSSWAESRLASRAARGVPTPTDCPTCT